MNSASPGSILREKSGESGEERRGEFAMFSASPRSSAQSSARRAESAERGASGDDSSIFREESGETRILERQILQRENISVDVDLIHKRQLSNLNCSTFASFAMEGKYSDDR